MSAERRTSFPGLQGMLERRHELVRELASARREQGLTQTEVAARIGTSQSAIARLETGDLDLRLSTLDRYANAVGTTLNWQVRPRQAQA